LYDCGQALTIDFSDLREKNVVKQNRPGVGITKMEKALVPYEYGMEVTSHMYPISYGK
jgi:hypothetical protein